MKKFFLCLLLALTLTSSAAALEVPTDTVVQNLNGSQQLIKTYVLSPDTDPQGLIEEPFEQEGYVKAVNFLDMAHSDGWNGLQRSDLGGVHFQEMRQGDDFRHQ